MYFTNTPSLNSIEAMMKRPPGSRQRGGGRNRSPYRYRKKDCDCRLCLYYRKRNGCVMKVCPVLDIRLSCKAASFREAVKAAFADVKHIPFQRRLSQIYDRKDDVPMLFQNDRHRQIFETQQISLRKPDIFILRNNKRHRPDKPILRNCSAVREKPSSAPVQSTNGWTAARR